MRGHEQADAEIYILQTLLDQQPVRRIEADRESAGGRAAAGDNPSAALQPTAPRDAMETMIPQKIPSL